MDKAGIAISRPEVMHGMVNVGGLAGLAREVTKRGTVFLITNRPLILKLKKRGALGNVA